MTADPLTDEQRALHIEHLLSVANRALALAVATIREAAQLAAGADR